MHPDEKLIRDFYAAFAMRDADAMARYYHPDIVFSDPVFRHLRGNEASTMWRMLLTSGKDLKITLLEASSDASGGRATWEAHYTFSKTGRPVVNRIDALFAFREGLIVRHIDHFPFWRWAKQALGPLGLLLGWSWPIKAMVRKSAARSLASFSARKND
ncbi:MAG: nuclear transport factor 2 family protein [Pseudomonadota bacterium]